MLEEKIALSASTKLTAFLYKKGYFAVPCNGMSTNKPREAGSLVILFTLHSLYSLAHHRRMHLVGV